MQYGVSINNDQNVFFMTPMSLLPQVIQSFQGRTDN